jgi:hypothetical protein
MLPPQPVDSTLWTETFRFVQTVGVILIGAGVRYLRKIMAELVALKEELVTLNKRTSKLEDHTVTHQALDDERHKHEEDRINAMQGSVDYLIRNRD